MSQPCPICSAPTKDGLMDRACTKAVLKDLSDLPGWMDEIELQLTRQGQLGTGNGGRGGESPLVFEVRAANNRDLIHRTIQPWTQDAHLADGSSPGTTITDWCTWLSQRINQIRGHQFVGHFADELRHCIHLAMQSVDLPPMMLPCGPCPKCGKPVAAPMGADQGVCRHCSWGGVESVVAVDHSLPTVLKRAREALVTRKQLLDAARLYQVSINASTLRTWVHRKALVEKEVTEDGQRLYRVGDVLDLAKANDDTQALACG